MVCGAFWLGTISITMSPQLVARVSVVCAPAGRVSAGGEVQVWVFTVGSGAFVQPFTDTDGLALGDTDPLGLADGDTEVDGDAEADGVVPPSATSSEPRLVSTSASTPPTTTTSAATTAMIWLRRRFWTARSARRCCCRSYFARAISRSRLLLLDTPCGSRHVLAGHRSGAPPRTTRPGSLGSRYAIRGRRAGR